MRDLVQVSHRPSPALAITMSSSETALFGKYKLGKLLGCGAFAKVYHARQISTGLSVAIKVINKSKLVNINLMSNVKREISIMRKLRHPNVVKIYEVLATKTKIFVVLEFVKGGELFGKVAKGRFSEDLSRKLFQQLISAIGYCHSRGVFHRDLKLENLLIDENGNLKVSDFGLSAVASQARSDGMLHTLCGTPAYVAPEILAKKGYDGATADVWSCGVVLFVLTAGYLPFNDPNLMNMYKKIYKGEFRFARWMSPDLRRFLSRILDTNPMSRITIDEMSRDPWFKKGYKTINFYDEDFRAPVLKEKENISSTMNAFDIISLSSGLDLSGMFRESPENGSERLLVGVSPKKIIEKVEEAAKGDTSLRMTKRKELRVDLEGQNGNSVIGFHVYRLTDTLAVVEVTRKAGDEGFYKKLWKEKIRPEILGHRDNQISGN